MTLTQVWENIVNAFKSGNDFLKDLEKLPQKMFQGEFYEEEDSRQKRSSYRRPRCANQVRVEDLRPSHSQQESA